MSTDDQKRASELHGEAHKAARDQVPPEILDRLAEVAEGRDDLRIRTAGEIAGAWMASPATHQGHELIAAGLLPLLGPVDGDRLVRAEGYEIANVDSFVVLGAPKLRPHLDGMRRNLAAALDIDVKQVSVKARSNDGLGEAGTGRACEAWATVLIYPAID